MPHDEHPVRDRPHHAQVVRDEQIAELKPLLQICEQIKNLRPYGDIEGRNRLIEHDELGPDQQSPSYGDTLPLPARKLMDVAIRSVRSEPHIAKCTLDECAAIRSHRGCLA
jgi:hypothetical protein